MRMKGMVGMVGAGPHELRKYQGAATDRVRDEWASGHDSVCLVAPTGSGKTRMGEELISDATSVVWVAPRREIVKQTAERLARRFGASNVGMLMGGHTDERRKRVLVATIQSLASLEGTFPTHLVLDESHHYVADDWLRIIRRHAGLRTLGLTATPERQDGTPLGDIFTSLVVAANYSELINGGFLVPVRAYRPTTCLGNDLAQDPVDSWLSLSEGSRAFVFCPRVEIAEATAQRFRDVGVIAATIEAETPSRERDRILTDFRRGRIKVITNVNTMTEGVDVPEARTVILAKAYGHAGAFMQACGRVLRTANGKEDAIMIDLTGASIRHGLPTDDREYSLSGRAISGAEFPERGDREAPEFSQEVRGVDLSLVARGSLPADSFPTPQPRNHIDNEARRRALEAMRSEAMTHGLRPSLGDILFAQKFGGR